MKHYELYKDEELVSMYRDGDARAVDEIMERYKNLVRKKAKSMNLVGGDKDGLIPLLIPMYHLIRQRTNQTMSQI